jgi:hypothetical protein
MWGVGAECVWVTWLSGEALGDMIGSKKTSEPDVKQELLSCMRPLLLTYAAITLPWATQSCTMERFSVCFFKFSKKKNICFFWYSFWHSVVYKLV